MCPGISLFSVPMKTSISLSSVLLVVNFTVWLCGECTHIVKSIQRFAEFAGFTYLHLCSDAAVCWDVSEPPYMNIFGANIKSSVSRSSINRWCTVTALGVTSGCRRYLLASRIDSQCFNVSAVYFRLLVQTTGPRRGGRWAMNGGSLRRPQFMSRLMPRYILSLASTKHPWCFSLYLHITQYHRCFVIKNLLVWAFMWHLGPSQRLPST